MQPASPNYAVIGMGTKSVAQTVAVDRGEIISRKTFLLRKHHRGRFCFFGGKHRAQTKAIKLFIFSCFAVETLRVSREEISFNIRFSHSPLFRPFADRCCFHFFRRKPESCRIMNHTTWSKLLLFFLLFSLCCETVFRTTKLDVMFMPIHEFQPYLIVAPYREADIPFHGRLATVFSHLNVAVNGSELKRDRRITRDRNRRIFTFMLPLSRRLEARMCLLLFQSFAPNFAHGTGNCRLRAGADDGVGASSLPSRRSPENEVIEKFVKHPVMCLSKSSIQMVNELTLMHAFLFAFLSRFFGQMSRKRNRMDS